MEDGDADAKSTAAFESSSDCSSGCRAAKQRNDSKSESSEAYDRHGCSPQSCQEAGAIEKAADAEHDLTAVMIKAVAAAKKRKETTTLVETLMLKSRCCRQASATSVARRL